MSSQNSEDVEVLPYYLWDKIENFFPNHRIILSRQLFKLL